MSISSEAGEPAQGSSIPNFEAAYQPGGACVAPMPNDPVADGPFRSEHELVRRLMRGEAPTARALRDRPIDEIMTDMLRSRTPTDAETFTDAVHLDQEMAHATGQPYLTDERLMNMQMRSPAPVDGASESYVRDLNRLQEMHQAGCIPYPMS
ncbi:MAG: hypothetical protein AMXMBFR33_33220 [Candidatus Xenobia bacterium]